MEFEAIMDKDSCLIINSTRLVYYINIITISLDLSIRKTWIIDRFIACYKSQTLTEFSAKLSNIERSIIYPLDLLQTRPIGPPASLMVTLPSPWTSRFYKLLHRKCGWNKESSRAIIPICFVLKLKCGRFIKVLLIFQTRLMS